MAADQASAGRLDVAGAVTVTTSLMLAVYAIVNGNEAGWTSAQTLGLLAAAAVLLALFLGIEARVRSPLMPLGLFRLRNVATANVVGVLWAAAMFAWFFISALYMQLVLGYSAMQVGLAFLPANLIMAAFSLGLSARIVMRFGIRTPLAVGLLLAAVGLALFARAPVDGTFVDRRVARHDPARAGRRHRVQPGAARRDERCRPERVRPRLRRRQHLVHDGRGARSRGPCEPCSRAHGDPARLRSRPAGRAQRRLPSCLFCRRGLRGGGGLARRSTASRWTAAEAAGSKAWEPTIPNPDKETTMLGTKDAAANIAVKNLETAKKFYEGTLGLQQIDADGNELIAYRSGDSTLLVYHSNYAGTNKATTATWTVGDDWKA